jgi:hypothetical protein
LQEIFQKKVNNLDSEVQKRKVEQEIQKYELEKTERELAEIRSGAERLTRENADF